MADLSVLMPVFNERATVEQAVHRVLETDFPVDEVEVVLVDDGSTDGTSSLLAQGDWPPQVVLAFHDVNRGKGSAVRTALGRASGRYTAIMDADLEYEPADLAALLQPILDGRAEVVFGTRGFESHSSYSFWYVVGNKLVTLAANVLFDRWLADIMTCHKVMSTQLFRSLDLRADGFEIEPEITARLLAAGHRIYEVPVTYNARSREQGKKLTATDGLRVLATLVRCRVTSGPPAAARASAAAPPERDTVRG